MSRTIQLRVTLQFSQLFSTNSNHASSVYMRTPFASHFSDGLKLIQDNLRRDNRRMVGGAADNYFCL